MASSLSPAEFGRQSTDLDNEMIAYNFLPFYNKVAGLDDVDVLQARDIAHNFCTNLSPPSVVMDTSVRETRGMPREEKVVDFMTPWLETMAAPEHDGRWDGLVRRILERGGAVADLDVFKTEVCRASIMCLLMQLTKVECSEAGYVYDIAPNIAVEQSEKELLVSQRLHGQKKKRTVSRRTLRGDLETRIQRYDGVV